MDITNLNFVERLPEITETIKQCDFIAIDTELSGLMRDRSLNRFDLPEERFAKAVELSRGYFIMQFGLSCFTRTKNDFHYTNRTYNFYIFPQANDGHGDIDRTFSLQVHAIQFLTEHGFDFNKLFKHGVSYLTFQEKKSITSQLKLEIKARAKVEIGTNGLPKFVPNNMTENCKSWLKKVKTFVEQRKSYAQKLMALDHDATSRMSTSIDTECDATNDGKRKAFEDCDNEEMTDNQQINASRLELRDCTTNHKRAIMKRVLECQPIFENIEIVNELDDKKNEIFLVIYYFDKTVKEEKQKNAFIVAKGFLEIIELVILNKKPIVGHNLALDLIQIINQFMEPLTDDYSAFKDICHSLFPLIFDTKFIAHSILDPETLTNNQSRLNDLYCQLRDSSTMPKIQVDHLDDFLDEKQQLPHQAGYDAYMSGYCFIVLCEAHIQNKRKYKFTRKEADATPLSIVQEHQIKEDFANKIHLSYSYDFKYFHLNGEEEEPDRNHVFYMEFPPTWSLDDMFQVFHPYGGVAVSRLSKTSALCALRDLKQLDEVTKKVVKHKDTSSNYKIYTYSSYLENFKQKKRKKDTSGDGGDVEFSNVT